MYNFEYIFITEFIFELLINKLILNNILFLDKYLINEF